MKTGQKKFTDRICTYFTYWHTAQSDKTDDRDMIDRPVVLRWAWSRWRSGRRSYKGGFIIHIISLYRGSRNGFVDPASALANPASRWTLRLGTSFGRWSWHSTSLRISHHLQLGVGRLQLLELLQLRSHLIQLSVCQTHHTVNLSLNTRLLHSNK